MTVLADKWQGKPLNAPNDVVVHPDGGIWFSDPGYGILVNYEGHLDKPQMKEAVYRIDPKTAKMEMMTDELHKPNGICFSPDYKKVYICDTGATHEPDAAQNHSGLRPGEQQAAQQQGFYQYRIQGRRDSRTASAPISKAISGRAAAGWGRTTTGCISSRRMAI